MDGVYFFSRWTRCTGIQFHRDWMVFESMQKNFSNRWKERTVSKLVFPGKLEIIKRCFTSFNRRGGIEATDDVARENRENVFLKENWREHVFSRSVNRNVFGSALKPATELVPIRFIESGGNGLRSNVFR